MATEGVVAKGGTYMYLLKVALRAGWLCEFVVSVHDSQIVPGPILTM